jgi:predicted glycoside hydrolase/deacetylase ChbG (UPF0249 family)
VDTDREAPIRGALIVNADDWGRDAETTDRILDCIRHGTVSSTSAMLFMEDSERAAGIAREEGIDAGLHLNFTTRFATVHAAKALLEHQERLTRFLTRNRFARTLYHPGLVQSFRYVVMAQVEEFRRLYGADPQRMDGHHHMHLCANVLLSDLLPAGRVVRRNFSFQPGEKSATNRLFRRATDAILARKHRTTDYFFSLPPLAPASRLEGIVALARHAVVEMETHPRSTDEYRFLTEGGMHRLAGDMPIASRYQIQA